MNINIIASMIILSPALGSLIAGFFSFKSSNFDKIIINFCSIGLVILSFLLSGYLSYFVYYLDNHYTVDCFYWAIFNNIDVKISFVIDRLSIFMMLIITFISSLVHIYSVGYMSKEAGYARFFSYISAFTFSMLCLVMSNNFLLLFFGWESVGLFSFLLIGYYFDQELANQASIRAFVINRIGDLGFLLGIAAIIYYCQSLDYETVFLSIKHISSAEPISFLGIEFKPVTMIGMFLFMGAMGKSAQFPLHTWLEGSMYGPTPISALIHAATMVTAGVFMVTRLSNIFIESSAVLSFIMITGSITCLFMGLVAIVQVDIKRVIAYCTLSQLGYMMVAQGSSAFSIGMFHLMTHAMFKSLLFLSAGSVIVALHHEQDMRKMGGLKQFLPITYICTLVGALALAAFPPFSGFFSKDLIIESVRITSIPFHNCAYYMVLSCAFITSFYIFRLIFMTFHGPTRMSVELTKHIKEPSYFILMPIIILTVPSVFAGIMFFSLQDFVNDTLFGNNVVVTMTSSVLSSVHAWSTWSFLTHALLELPFLLSISGLVLAYLFYVQFPSLPKRILRSSFLLRFFHKVLIKKYFIEHVYEFLFVRCFLRISKFLCNLLDIVIIHKFVNNGSIKIFWLLGLLFKHLQSGYIFNYVFVLFTSLTVIMYLMIMSI